ncbi:MAG TPA: helix-turn-helix domain-containing protein [Prolixibacteraceae bacterium]|nr:helix-turn-helix domain-containing protein [Prolixibacteraceae bacterium]
MKSRFILTVVIIFGFTASAGAAALTVKQQSVLLKNRLNNSGGDERVDALLKLASFCPYDSANQAIAFSRQAIAESQRLQDNHRLARSYVSLASFLLRKIKQSDSVFTYLTLAEKAFTQSGSGQATAKYFYNTALYYLRTGDTVRAVDMSQMAIEKAEMENDHLTAALSGMMLGRISRQNGDFKGFTGWLAKAQESFLLCEEKQLAGPSMISLGILYKDAGLPEKGDKALIQATGLCEQSGDSLYVAYLYCNVAGIFQSGANPEKGLFLLKKAETIFQSLNNDKGLGYALNHQGIYFQNNRKFQEAVSCFTRAISCNTRSGDWQGACFAACNLAEVFMEKRDYEETTATFREAEQYMLKAGDKLSATVYYNTFGKFLLQNKQFTEALTMFDSSLHYARESFNHNFVSENLKQIAGLHQSQGNESLALQFYKSYIAAGDSVKEASNLEHYRDMQNELTLATGSSSNGKASPSGIVPGLNDAAIPATIIIMIFLMAISIRKYSKNSGEKNKDQPLDQPLSSANPIPGSQEFEDPIVPKNGRLMLSPEMSSGIFQRLTLLMEEDRYYLRSEVSLHELAVELGTNTSYLSRVINEQTGGNFHSFLNKFRIEEACRLLKDQRQQVLSMEGIALSAGFRSKSAFHVAFRKFKGMTPSEYCGNTRESAE